MAGCPLVSSGLGTVSVGSSSFHLEPTESASHLTFIAKPHTWNQSVKVSARHALHSRHAGWLPHLGLFGWLAVYRPCGVGSPAYPPGYASSFAGRANSPSLAMQAHATLPPSSRSTSPARVFVVLPAQCRAPAPSPSPRLSWCWARESESD